jgi:hypothetical protein
VRGASLKATKGAFARSHTKEAPATEIPGL